MTHKKKLQLTASETSLRRVTGLPEQYSGGTIRMYEKPRFEERQLAPIYLRPVTFALRAPEGVLRRRHYILLHSYKVGFAHMKWMCFYDRATLTG